MKKIAWNKILLIWPKFTIYLIIALLILGFLYSNRILFDNTEAKLKKTDPEISAAIYSTLNIMDKVFTENNIDYWIEAGTLLGAVRHKGIIPWNDDADVYFNESDLQKLIALKATFEKKGFQLVECYGGYKLMPKRRPSRKRYPSIDLAPTKLEDGLIIPSWSSSSYRSKHKSIYFTPKELYPLKRMTFGPLMLKAPNKPKGFLDRYYGDDWPKVAYRIFDHQKWKKVPEVKMKLTQCLPAEYDEKVFQGKWPDTWKEQSAKI